MLQNVDIDQGIHKGKMKVALNEKRKKVHGFSFSINIAHFEAFLQRIKLTKKRLFSEECRGNRSMSQLNVIIGKSISIYFGHCRMQLHEHQSNKQKAENRIQKKSRGIYLIEPKFTLYLLATCVCMLLLMNKQVCTTQYIKKYLCIPINYKTILFRMYYLLLRQLDKRVET